MFGSNHSTGVHSMDSTILFREDNTLKLQFSLSNHGHYVSPEYEIRDLIFQFKTIWIEKYMTQMVRLRNTSINDSCGLIVHLDKFNTTAKITCKNDWLMVYQTTSGLSDKVFHITATYSLIKDTVPPFATIYEDQKLLDFELVGTDGSVKFHKALLAATIPVLRQMLCNGNWRESKDGKLKVKNTSRQTIQHLKDYVYLNTLPNSGIPQLLVLACFYMMTELQDKCIKYLIANLTQSNVIETLDFARDNIITKLTMDILKAVQNNKIDVDSIHFPYGQVALVSVAGAAAENDLTDSTLQPLKRPKLNQP